MNVKLTHFYLVKTTEVTFYTQINLSQINLFYLIDILNIQMLPKKLNCHFLGYFCFPKLIMTFFYFFLFP